jgi:hypothetical protein
LIYKHVAIVYALTSTPVSRPYALGLSTILFIAKTPTTNLSAHTQYMSSHDSRVTTVAPSIPLKMAIAFSCLRYHN